MIFDTDIFIWVQRGNEKAARLIYREEIRLLSAQTYMDLLQCARTRQQHDYTRAFLPDLNFRILPMSENIGNTAAVYTEPNPPTHRLRDERGALMKPVWMHVTTTWRSRGGIRSRITANHGDVPAP